VTQDRLGGAFAGLWTASAATAVGTQVTAVALPLLAVVVLHASPAQAGLLATAQWLPFLVVALPLGVLMDRMRRRPLLVVAEAGRAAGLLAVVVLAAAGGLALPPLLGLALLLGCCAVLFEVGAQSYLPTVVRAADLDTANSRVQSTEAVALVAGPGLAGTLVQAVGAAGALAVQVVTSAVSAVALVAIRRPEPRPAGTPSAFLPALREGLAFLLRDRVLLGLVGFSAIYNPFEQWISVLFTIDAVRRLGLGAAQLGAVLAIGALGALAGALVAPWAARRVGALVATLWCAAVESVVLLGLPLADPAWGAAGVMAATGAVLAVNSAATALSSVVLLTVRQRRTPDPLRGRVNAATRAVSYGSITLGALAGGIAGEALGVRGGLALGCAGVLLTVVWTLAWGLPLHRRGVRIDAPAVDEPQAAPGAGDPPAPSLLR
jgi:MFS family permease